MAQKKASSRRRKRQPARGKQDQRLARHLGGLLVLLLLIVGFCQLGLIGEIVVDCFKLIGGQSAWALMGISAFLALWVMIYARLPKLVPHFFWGLLLAYLGLALVLHAQMFGQLSAHSHFALTTWNNLNRALFNGDSTVLIGGGMVGAAVYSLAYLLLNQLGALALGWLLIVVGVVVFFRLPWQELFPFLQHLLAGIAHLVKEGAAAGKAQAAQPRRQRTRRRPGWLSRLFKPRPSAPAASADPAVSAPASASPAPSAAEAAPVAASPKPAAPKINVAAPLKSEEPAAEEADSASPAFATGPVDDDDYQLPPTSLLTPVGSTDQSQDLQAIKQNTRTLAATLASFGVEATVENVNLGPSVTEYELKPATGVKVAKITHLADDLALALAAKGIRIEAPIPGKSLVGIEVPNQAPATVGFKDLIEAMPPSNHPLEVPLGRAVNGEVVTADLAKMPHLLIAGATGSGKSVAINVILTSLLMRTKPSQVKLLMVDPKRVELSVYNQIPHLLSPVVSDPKKAAKALAKVVAEMERRYELFASFGIRNLAGYNAEVKAHPEEDQAPLPLILVIIDELADLMMTVSKEVEDSIVRIAQMGRAAGIHMVIATQRPSVDVITGLIKANVPSRIAFAVSSGIDSRTILDANGAEKLLGRGDMLFQPIDKNKPQRIQGAFISDQDVEAVVDFIKEEQPADYDQQMVVTDTEIAEEEEHEGQDPLFDDALAFVIDQQRASTSMIQRRFRIGYNRAARLIDDLEQQGYVGPANGAKPREVYPDRPEG